MDESDIAATWSAFVQESIGDLPYTAVAAQIDVSPNTVGNWVKGAHFTQPAAKLVIRFARAFQRPLPTALVAAGYGDASEYTETVLKRPDASKMTAEQIVETMADLVTEMRQRNEPKKRTRLSERKPSRKKPTL